MIKIIIVEDEEMIRRGLVHTMDWLSMGALVVADAKNGKEGLNLILELRPDVVMTDIKMPLMDGFEMLEKAKEIYSFHSIILTSYQEFDYAKKAISLDAMDYLLKPVTEEDLKKTLLKIQEKISFKENWGEKSTDKLQHDFEQMILKNRAKNYYVQVALDRLMESYHDRVSIESIALELGVSASYLSRKFKQITNRTYLEILNEYRVIQAVKLLGEGRYRVSEVAEKTGFSDYKHFYSVFKKYTGMTPSDYAKGE